MSVDLYEAALFVGGLAALVAAWVPAYTSQRPLSLPIVLVAIGAGFFLLPVAFPPPDPREHVDLTERATELVVIVALMGAGLKIDRPFGWREWSLTWRMIAIAMPITIVATAVLGWAVGGLAATTALLLGAVISPTDPVLASDVQVGEPSLGDGANPEAEDDVRFALTSEGGLNDALAFPFVYAAIAVAEHGWAPSGWALEWVAWDLVGRVLIGAAVGWAIGRVLGAVAFRPPGRLSALAETPQGFVAVAGTLLAYGGTELLGGYGFLAVFVAAVVLRGTERQHEFHADLHGFAEQTENLLVVALLFLFGGALVSGVLGSLTWQGGVVAIVTVFVVRPAAGLLALAGSHLAASERIVISFFGIRGFGSVYYLAYAVTAAAFADVDELWAIVAATLALSIAVHGIGATPAMELVDRAGRRRSPSEEVQAGR